MANRASSSPKLDLMGLSHHAYCLVGGDDARAQVIGALATEFKISAEGNPDFFDRRFQAFSIDDARELKSYAETRPIDASGRKIFIITVDNVASEAQNALLKLFEEPPLYAHFFLIVPSAHLLLPTIKSRMIQIGGAMKPDRDLAEAQAFIDMPPAKRIDFIKGLTEDIAKEKLSKQDAVEFLGALEEAVRRRGVRKNQAALESILAASKYATDRAPSLKMLLESVALCDII